MKAQPQFDFSPEQLSEIRASLKAYFLDELEMELGDLQIDLFIHFFNEELGKHYYNLGLTDAIGKIKDAADDLVLLVKE